MKTVSQILKEKFWIARPLNTILEEAEGVRFNIVTDDISKKSLFGGVATALILATILCDRNQWTLRIITRTEPCNLNNYYKFLEIYKLKAPQKVEAYSDENYDSDIINFSLPISDSDIFMATSWWSAKSLLDSNINRRILYIIQEEETFFYNYSDDRLCCEKVMDSPQIDYIVNSKLLYDYLKNHNYDSLSSNSWYFEPAFPSELYFTDENTFKEKKEKKKLFFYGRPKNPRNLFYFGLECLDNAIERGIIDTDLWDIYFAGSEMENFSFCNGYSPKINGVMGWKEYAAFARTVDLAFCLMYTPHPSYPPFDMLCSGAVVLSNQFENKQHLKYSSNLLLKELDKEEMIKGLTEGLELASNLEKRKENYLHNCILRSWEDSFESILADLEERINKRIYV